MGRWSRWVLAHRRLLTVMSVLLFIAGAAAASKLNDRLSQTFEVPGRAGFEANAAILRTYGNGGLQPPVVAVIRLPEGASVRHGQARIALARGMNALARQPGLRVVSYVNTGDARFASTDGRTTFALAFPPPQPAVGAIDFGPPLTAALTRALPPGWDVRITGIAQLQLGGDTSGPSVLVETLVGAVGALVVLAFVFGSLLALVPLLVAAVSITTTFLIIYGVTELTDVSVIVQYLVALIGLGVAIDYSLLLVTRWREEQGRGRTGWDAVHAAMATAGRAVVISGATVTIGLASMIVLPVPALRSIGYAGLLIPLVSVVVTLTLLPVVLAVAGRRLDWPHRRKDTSAGRGWTGWARGIVRLRWAAVVAGLAILLPLGVSAFGLHLGTPKATSLAKSGPAHDGLTWLRQAQIPTGVLTPLEVLVPAGTDPAHVATRLGRVPGVRAAVAPADSGWRHQGSAVVDVQPTAETSTSTGKDIVEALRHAAKEFPGVQAGGVGPYDIDYASAVYGSFPLMFALIVLVTLILLTRAFRSLVLAIQAVILNLVSIGAVYGAVVLIFQDGHGSGLFGIPATGAVQVGTPLAIFAFLYGLSMDYEVFIVSRIREAYDKERATDAAIVEGIGRTGRLVTSAALILVLAFAALSSGPDVNLKILATGLAVGILLDATVVRALLVPALISIFRSANWWLPSLKRSPVGVATSTENPAHLADQQEH